MQHPEVRAQGTEVHLHSDPQGPFSGYKVAALLLSVASTFWGESLQVVSALGLSLLVKPLRSYILQASTHLSPSTSCVIRPVTYPHLLRVHMARMG